MFLMYAWNRWAYVVYGKKAPPWLSPTFVQSQNYYKCSLLMDDPMEERNQIKIRKQFPKYFIT